MFQRSLNSMKSLGCDSEQMPEFPVPRHSKPVVFPAINAPARSTQVSHSFQAIIDQLVQQHLTEITELSQLRVSNEDRGFRPRHDSKPSLPLLYKCSVYATGSNIILHSSNCLSWFLSLIIASILLRQCKVHCIQVEMSHWTASAYNVVPLLQWKWLECMGKWSATFCTAPVASWFVCFREDTCTAIKSQASEIHWHLLQLIMPEPARFELWKFGEKLKSTESMHWCALPCD